MMFTYQYQQVLKALKTAALLLCLIFGFYFLLFGAVDLYGASFEAWPSSRLYVPTDGVSSLQSHATLFLDTLLLSGHDQSLDLAAGSTSKKGHAFRDQPVTVSPFTHYPYNCSP